MSDPLTLNPDSCALVMHDLLRDPGRDRLDPERSLSSLDLYIKDQDIRHFSAWEIVGLGTVKGVTNVPPSPFLWANIIPTLRVAEWLRFQFGGKPVLINSGFRSDAYNRAVGGAQDSLHRRFNALDLRIAGVDPGAIAAKLNTHPDSKQLGVGTYDSFVHVDVRGLLHRTAPARWDERTKRAA